MDFILEIANGLIQLPWWGYVLVALGLTHITIAAVTIFLHRHQAHRALELHPVVSHFFRFWLWLTTGMVTKEWAAVHRKHHARWKPPKIRTARRCTAAQGAAGRYGTLPYGSRQRGNAGEIRSWDTRRLDRAQPLHEARHPGGRR